LGLHGAFFDRAGELKHAVGQGGFAMVDVGDNAEISDMGLVHQGLIIAGFDGFVR
jgi:hypothetical protein